MRYGANDEKIIPYYKIQDFYCPFKVPARGRFITVICITKTLTVHYNINKQYTKKYKHIGKLVQKEVTTHPSVMGRHPYCSTSS